MADMQLKFKKISNDLRSGLGAYAIYNLKKELIGYVSFDNRQKKIVFEPEFNKTYTANCLRVIRDFMATKAGKKG